MASLGLVERNKLERLFKMEGGYVLDFSDAKFASFFNEIKINIDDSKYTTNKPSRSKANRLRGFWEQEDDVKVGKILKKLIEYAKYLKGDEKNWAEEDEKLIADCINIANKLTGESIKTDASISKDDFLATDFGEINFSKLPVEAQLRPILESRLDEAQKCLKNNINLSAIFMAGSILEGVLLGAAQKYPKQFNKSHSCPKDNKTGKPKAIDKWTLSELINVGNEINLLDEDIKKFSHALRDFRNYIHPYQQMSTGFQPTKDTAKICLHVLKAALSELIKNRPKENT